MYASSASHKTRNRSTKGQRLVRARALGAGTSLAVLRSRTRRCAGPLSGKRRLQRSAPDRRPVWRWLEWLRRFDADCRRHRRGNLIHPSDRGNSPRVALHSDPRALLYFKKLIEGGPEGRISASVSVACMTTNTAAPTTSSTHQSQRERRGRPRPAPRWEFRGPNSSRSSGSSASRGATGRVVVASRCP